ncbi:hypothetical protein B0H13DRAFT_2342636 [Mycena leptocephala]|nr:hypothetical protein B0H13DRAFT_2342636 [Mycena leptocephala]
MLLAKRILRMFLVGILPSRYPVNPGFGRIAFARYLGTFHDEVCSALRRMIGNSPQLNAVRDRGLTLAAAGEEHRALFALDEYATLSTSVSAMVSDLDLACHESMDPPDAAPLVVARHILTGRRGRPRVEIDAQFLRAALELRGPTGIAPEVGVSSRTGQQPSHKALKSTSGPIQLPADRNTSPRETPRRKRTYRPTSPPNINALNFAGPSSLVTSTAENLSSSDSDDDFDEEEVEVDRPTRPIPRSYSLAPSPAPTPSAAAQSPPPQSPIDPQSPADTTMGDGDDDMNAAAAGHAHWPRSSPQHARGTLTSNSRPQALPPPWTRTWAAPISNIMRDNSRRTSWKMRG